MTAKLTEPTKRIRKEFIAHLAQKYVVDESSNYPRAISASGRHQNLPSLTFEFAPWAKGHASRRVPESEFTPFITGLESAIRGGLPRVCGISFKPVASRSFVDSKGDTLLNTYIPYTPERPANYAAVKAVLDQYADRLFHQSEDDKKYVLQLCGDIVANPARRPQWGVIMRGMSGTGKSSLIGLLKVATGGRYVWSENDYSPAFSQFSEVLPNSLVVCFDDATAGRHTYEDLKLAVTRDTANVQIKGVQSILEREVFARVFVLSNSHRPFMMPADDRRFYVTEYLTHLHDLAESETYYEGFTTFWKNPDHAAAIHWWLRELASPDFTPHACVKTEARKQLVAMSTSSADTAIAEFLGGREVSHIDSHGLEITETPPVQTVFHESQLTEFLGERRVPEMPPDMLRRKLTEAGYEEKRRTVEGCNNGKQIDLWQKVIPGQRRASSLTPEQVSAIAFAYNRNAF
jgi:hypothetical protein